MVLNRCNAFGRFVCVVHRGAAESLLGAAARDEVKIVHVVKECVRRISGIGELHVALFRNGSLLIDTGCHFVVAQIEKDMAGHVDQMAEAGSD